MIQRIQTVYLLLSAILLGMLFQLNLADITAGGEMYLFNIQGIFKGTDKVFNGLPLMMFLSLILLLHVYVIFNYRNRIRQMRILGFSIILLVGMTGLLLYFAWSGFKGATVSFRIPVVFPIVAAILDYLAIRGIGKDEALIRSIDRLRP